MALPDREPNKKTNHGNAQKYKRVDFATHTGERLTPLQAKFIDKYIETGNGKQSVIEAGYTCKNPAQMAQKLLNTPYINEEVRYRLEQAKDESIADATEIMRYFTKVMRGEINDQFGLDAPLSERTRAAQELAKRQIDIPQKLQGQEPPKLTITVDWGENASASVEEIGESVDTATIADLYDTKKRDNLE
jgi:phage terminase small subunit